ncbi:glycosyltransferase family 2 protein [Methylobacter sp.]|uniref:glycosyltransferase family 2 protein n=1 Tax=Methylobacter sp. TaxID=2051955 RepID=UPI003DA43A24
MKKEQKKLAIIFICYNCGPDIAANILDIKNMDIGQASIQFIVVDNASSDDSINIISSLNLDNIKIIKNKNNYGFAKACNQGLLDVDADYYLLLNPDIKLFKDSLSNLLKFATDYPSAGIWGGVTINGDGVLDSKNAWREPSLWGLICWAFFLTRFFSSIQKFTPDQYINANWELANQVDSISGCFFLIDSSLWKKLNGFDERFFMYSEEIDLCNRARKLGAQPMVTNQAIIMHYGSGTITSDNKLNYLYKSKLIYFKKHWSYGKFVTARIVMFIAVFLRSLSFGFDNGSWMRLLSNMRAWEI